MSKKGEIINLINQGESVENIVQRGFNKKYVYEIIRDLKKKGISSDDNSKTDNSVSWNHSLDSFDIKNETLFTEELQKNSFKDANYKEYKISSVNDLNKIQNFIKNIKKYSSYIQNIEVSIKVDLNFSHAYTKEDLEQKEEVKIIKEPKFNPIETYRKGGEEELLALLKELEVEDMKDIIRKYLPDPRGYVYKWKDVEKIINYIIQRTSKLAVKGNVFFSE